MAIHDESGYLFALNEGKGIGDVWERLNRSEADWTRMRLAVRAVITMACTHTEISGPLAILLRGDHLQRIGRECGGQNEGRRNRLWQQSQSMPCRYINGRTQSASH